MNNKDIQDWITLELAVRIHCSKGATDMSEAGKKNLRTIRLIVFTVLSVGLAAFCIIVVVCVSVTKTIAQSITTVNRLPY